MKKTKKNITSAKADFAAFEKRAYEVGRHFYEEERGPVELKVIMGPRFFEKIQHATEDLGPKPNAISITMYVNDFGSFHFKLIDNDTWNGFLIVRKIKN